jgi:hypothetical protein
MTYKEHIRRRTFNVTTCMAVRILFKETRVRYISFCIGIYIYISVVSGMTLGCVDVTAYSSIRKYGGCQPLIVNLLGNDFLESLLMLSFCLNASGHFKNSLFTSHPLDSK